MNIPSAKEAREKVEKIKNEELENLRIAQRRNLAKEIPNAISQGKYRCDMGYHLLPEVQSELIALGYTVVKTDNSGHRISW